MCERGKVRVRCVSGVRHAGHKVEEGRGAGACWGEVAGRLTLLATLFLVQNIVISHSHCDFALALFLAVARGSVLQYRVELACPLSLLVRMSPTPYGSSCCCYLCYHARDLLLVTAASSQANSARLPPWLVLQARMQTCLPSTPPLVL